MYSKINAALAISSFFFSFRLPVCPPSRRPKLQSVLADASRLLVRGSRLAGRRRPCRPRPSGKPFTAFVALGSPYTLRHPGFFLVTQAMPSLRPGLVTLSLPVPAICAHAEPPSILGLEAPSTSRIVIEPSFFLTIASGRTSARKSFTCLWPVSPSPFPPLALAE